MLWLSRRSSRTAALNACWRNAPKRTSGSGKQMTGHSAPRRMRSVPPSILPCAAHRRVGTLSVIKSGMSSRADVRVAQNSGNPKLTDLRPRRCFGTTSSANAAISSLNASRRAFRALLKLSVDESPDLRTSSSTPSKSILAPNRSANLTACVATWSLPDELIGTRIRLIGRDADAAD